MRALSRAISTAGRVVACLLIAAVLGLSAYGLFRALFGPPRETEQERAVKAIEAAGGSVTRDGDRPGAPVVRVDLDSLTKDLRPRFLGDEDLARLRPGLEALTDLRHVRIGSMTTVTDAGLRQLQGLPRLKVLELYCRDVTPQGLEDFRRSRPDVTVSHRSPDLRPLPDAETLARMRQGIQGAKP
jgi:hypothetical protein